MNYLIYIEHAAENLQFFLWYRDYCKRFEQTPASERALAPEWTAAQAEAAIESTQHKTLGQKQPTAEVAAIFKGTDFEKNPKVKVSEQSGGDPFSTPPRTPRAEESNASLADWKSGTQDEVSTLKSPSTVNFPGKAADAFKTADLKWQPCMFIRMATFDDLLTTDFSHDPTVP